MLFDTTRPARPDMTSLPEVVAYTEHLEDLLDDVATDNRKLSRELGSSFEDTINALSEWDDVDTSDYNKVDGKVVEALMATLLETAETLLSYADPEAAVQAWRKIGSSKEARLKLLLQMPPDTRAALRVEDFQRSFGGIGHYKKDQGVFLSFFKTGATGQPDIDAIVWRMARAHNHDLALKIVELRLPFNSSLSAEDLLPFTSSADSAIRSRAILATDLVGPHDELSTPSEAISPSAQTVRPRV